MSLPVQIIAASPIQRLTFDALWHIFGYVSLSDPHQGPMIVSHVSRHWRQVALNSPLIWSNVIIRLTGATGTGSPQPQHRLASAYFRRSRDVSIVVTIHATRPFRVETREREELLQRNAHRIRFLYIKASEGHVANLLWTQMQMDMPMPRLEVFETVILVSDSHISVIATPDENTGIIPPVSDSLALWDLWSPTGLTVLTLETACLWNKPDLNDIYHILSTTCCTIQHFKYLGLISSIDDTEVNRNHLEFPELRSLTVFCNDSMVPLLQLMIIPNLESLILRDFVTHPAAIPTTELMEEIDNDTLTFEPEDLFQAIKQWTTITRLEIYGIDEPSDDLSSPRPELSNYLESLNDLSSLVLYGIGAATSVAYALFMLKKPFLPNLSCFLLGISPNNDLSHHLCDYLIARQCHQLPRLQKLSVNLGYIRQLCNLNRIGVLWESSDDIFVVADPEVGKFIPIEEERLPRRE